MYAHVKGGLAVSLSATKKKQPQPTLLQNENILTRIVKNPYFFPTLCVLTLVLGFIFRLYDTHLTAYNISKHDLGYTMGLTSNKLGSGHLGYIEYIARNEALPNFNPTTRWSFYNPPFFHICAAILLRVFTGLGIPEAESWELTQYLPCLAILFATIGMYKILKHFDIKGLPLWLGCVLVAFHPSLTYLSLALNNDAFSLMLTVWAIYFALKWYREPTTKSIVGVALCIGLGMMTKLTVALVAPPVALLFVVKFFKAKQYIPHLKQFGVFSAICFPTGLFWSIRNMWLYDIPLTYVQALPEGSAQDVSGYSMWERFGFPAFSDFLRIDSSWSRGTADHNLWSQTLRTSLFDDNALTWATETDKNVATFLMVASLILFVLLSVVTVIGLIRAKHVSPLLRVFVGLACGLLLLNFVKFCNDYPMTCTIHFRYITPVLLYGGLGLGLFWSSSKKQLSAKIVVGLAAVLILSTSVLSAMLYVNCLPPLVVA